MAEMYRGFVDEIDNGWVWGRVMFGGKEVEFSAPFLLVNESARTELCAGSYVTLRNGDLAHDCTIWTTRDMEEADREARRLHRTLVSAVGDSK